MKEFVGSARLFLYGTVKCWTSWISIALLVPALYSIISGGSIIIPLWLLWTLIGLLAFLSFSWEYHKLRITSQHTTWIKKYDRTYKEKPALPKYLEPFFNKYVSGAKISFDMEPVTPGA